MTQTHSTDHDISDRTVLVTGGAGFIGSHIADALVDDNTVRVLDDLSSGRRSHVPGGAELVVGDVRDEDILAEVMAGVDIVFHEAAVVSVEHSVDAPIETDDTNTGATLRVLEAARQQDARVVIASSAAIYGHPEYVPVDEAHPTTATSPYGVTKIAGDQYARLYESLYGLPTVALRYFNAYGPRQRGGAYSGVISLFVEQALAGDPITINGDGKQTRDFVHVDDIVRANLLAATTDSVGEAFNVGTGETVTIRELAELIRDVTDSNSPIEHTDPREGDVRHSCAEVTAARKGLGFEPSITLADGLKTVPGVEQRKE
jgi:UDP-glucose 4-epimerase